jgi:rRNA maturation RNase YbeY
VTPQEELARLIIHGVLHLLGYDHIRTSQARRMRRREARHLGACLALVNRVENATD